MPPDGGEVIAEGSRETGGLMRRHGWKLLLLFAGVLLPMWAFMELADEVHEAEAIPFDEPILLFAQQVAHDGFDRVFLFFSEIGYAKGVVPVDIGLVLVLLALRRWRDALFAALATTAPPCSTSAPNSCSRATGRVCGIRSRRSRPTASPAAMRWAR